MKITHVHRGIKFEDSDWMKKYIDLNTKLRAQAKSDFEKDFFKLMNNSVFGKTMENIRNRVDISLVNSEKKAKKLAAKPSFKHCTIFSEHLCAIDMKKKNLEFNKPVYLGASILDLSKTLMYDFHYNYIKPKYNEKAKLLFTDTDSLAYEIDTKDFYKDISDDVVAKFDTSNFPTDHPSGIQVGARENEVRERIPHTCPSSYENFFQSIFVSASCGVAILMSTCYWSVRMTSFNFKLCGGLSGKSSERRLFKKSRSFSRVLIANEPRYISKLEK